MPLNATSALLAPLSGFDPTHVRLLDAVVGSDHALRPAVFPDCGNLDGCKLRMAVPNTEGVPAFVNGVAIVVHPRPKRKMRGVDASPIVARVHDNGTPWNSAVRQRVGVPMCSHRLFPGHQNYSIPTRVPSASPLNARPRLLGARPKDIRGAESCMPAQRSSFFQPVITPLAETSRHRGGAALGAGNYLVRTIAHIRELRVFLTLARE